GSRRIENRCPRLPIREWLLRVITPQSQHRNLPNHVGVIPDDESVVRTLNGRLSIVRSDQSANSGQCTKKSLATLTNLPHVIYPPVKDENKGDRVRRYRLSPPLFRSVRNVDSRRIGGHSSALLRNRLRVED